MIYIINIKQHRRSHIAQFAIVKNINTIHAAGTEIQTVEYQVESGNCYYGHLAVKGKKAVVTAGHKIKKGSVVTIEYAMANKYAARQTCLFSDEFANPAVLVITEDGSKVWTQGKNINILPEELQGFVEKVSFDTEKEARAYCAEKYCGLNKTGAVWAMEGDQPVKKSNFISDYGMSVYSSAGKKCFKEVGDNYAMVIDDWRTDTYYFVAFSKKPGLNNLVEYVSTGTPKRGCDMSGETGLADAIKAFNAYTN